MGAIRMSDLPPGFVLDQAASSLPEGFKIDTPRGFEWTKDTITGRAAKTLYDAITLPGDVYQGKVSITGEDGHTNIEAINRAADLASIASPISPAARIGVGWAGVLKRETAPAPTQEALASAATAGYDKARNLGVEINPQGISALSDKISSHLNESGIDGELAPKTFSILGRIKNPPADAVVTVPNLETIRRSLGHAAGDFSNPTEQIAASRAKEHLADYLASIPNQDVIRGPASELSGVIKDANANYAASQRSEQIADALRKAELENKATNSGRNLDNKTRQAFVKILTNDKAGAGFTQPELDAAERLVRGSKSADLMRSSGNFLGGGGGMGMLHGSAAGAAVGAAAMGPIGAAIGTVTPPALGYLLKKGADASTLSKVEAFQQMVRNRSPLASSSPTAVGSASPKQALMARMIASGFIPKESRESASEKFKRELMLRSALAGQGEGGN